MRLLLPPLFRGSAAVLLLLQLAQPFATAVPAPELPGLRTDLTPQFLEQFLDPKHHPRLLLHEAAFSHLSVVACIPSKNGITTTRSVFYHLKHPQAVPPRNPYDNSQFTWVDKLPVQHALKLLTGNNVLRLAVLRNPFERLASAYVNKVVEPRASDYVKQYVKARCNITKNPLTFTDFVVCVTSQNPMKVDRHFMPQVHWCGLDHVQYDHFLTTRNLAGQLKAVMEMYNYTVFGVPRLNRSKRRKRTDWRAMYTKQLRALVEEYYAIDFQFLSSVFNKTSIQEFWDHGL